MPRSRPVMSAAVVAFAAGAALAAEPGTSLTIYSSAQPGAIDASLYRPTRGVQYGYGARPEIPGAAVVREVRPFDLGAGPATLKFTDVAAMIDPTTVSFKSLTDPEGTSVLEQNFQFDLVSSEKLLEKYIDKPIAVTVVRGQNPQTLEGTLLSISPGGFVLRTDEGVEIVNGFSGISLPEAHADLVTRPTLNWLVTTKKPGKHDVRLAYETEGITWWADYNLVYTDGKDANHGTLDAAAWVSILNQSGATYKDAQLKLIAGEINRAPKPQQMINYARRGAVAELAAADGNLGFQEKSFFEYHMYTLGRTTTIADNSTKQVELFPTARGVPCDKILMYDGLASNSFYDYGSPMTDQNFGVQSVKDVNIFLKFKNDQASHMGMPLPAGRVRVSKADPADGSLELIGEDVLRHTPRDEEVLVRLGKAFDVVGERKQVEYSVNVGRNEITETIEIKVRNRKQEAADVVVQERMYRWANWEFTGKAPTHKKLDARTVHFPLTLKPGEEGVIRYSVRYTW